MPSTGSQPIIRCVGFKHASGSATQEKKWGKVKALQRLLTHSFSGKVLAVRRVTENQGKHTPGVDKITWNTPHKKINAVYSLRQRGYHPQPLRRISIPKKNGKKRPLGIPIWVSYCFTFHATFGIQKVATRVDQKPSPPHAFYSTMLCRGSQGHDASSGATSTDAASR